MNGDRTPQAFATLDEWQRVQRPRELLRFAPVVALSTAGGCAVVALCLWTVVPAALWPVWLATGAAVSLVQWWAQRFIGPGRSGKTDPLGRRRWIHVNAFGAGAFWGLTTFMLFPSGSVEHQLLLAFILMAVTALWLPMFALAPLALLLFTVPGLLPMAFGLLASPNPPQATMGSLLLMLIGIFGAAAQTTSRIFFADLAARRALYHEATHDSLVGLANRAEFHRRAQTLEIMGARPYAMLFIDLDHFKEVNDSAGHAAGDELLRRVGAVLRETVRKEDLPARLGGDEFAILMEDCGAPDALHVAATILDRLNTFALSGGGQRRRVTASIGVACSGDLCASPAKLLEAADQACYVAKRGGRNRIEIATGTATVKGAEAARRRAGGASFALISDVTA
jgi:diguanylate cyclase (GGDEF)-like protein